MTIWSELGVFLPFLYAFFFSMKSELWILASHIWPADIMDYGHIKQSLGLYFRSAHVSEPSEEITHRSFTESLSCYKTFNPFVNPTSNALLGIYLHRPQYMPTFTHQNHLSEAHSKHPTCKNIRKSPCI